MEAQGFVDYAVEVFAVCEVGDGEVGGFGFDVGDGGVEGGLDGGV